MYLCIAASTGFTTFLGFFIDAVCFPSVVGVWLLKVQGDLGLTDLQANYEEFIWYINELALICLNTLVN